MFYHNLIYNRSRKSDINITQPTCEVRARIEVSSSDERPTCSSSSLSIYTNNLCPSSNLSSVPSNNNPSSNDYNMNQYLPLPTNQPTVLSYVPITAYCPIGAAMVESYLKAKDLKTKELEILDHYEFKLEIDWNNLSGYLSHKDPRAQ